MTPLLILSAIFSASDFPHALAWGYLLLACCLVVWSYTSLGEPFRRWSWVVFAFAGYCVFRIVFAGSSDFVMLSQPLILAFLVSRPLDLENVVDALGRDMFMLICAASLTCHALGALLDIPSLLVFYNENPAGVISALFLIYAVSEKGNPLLRGFAIGAAALVVVLSASRGAFLLLFTYCAAAYVPLGARLFAKRGVFLAFCLAVVSSPFLMDPELLEGTSLDSVEFLGKPIETGRQIIWPIILDQWRQSFLLGYGRGDLGDLLPEEYFGMSAHNLYLQTGYEYGAIGLALLAFVLIAQHARLPGSSTAGRCGRALLCGVMVNQMFEVSLTQNSFSIGIVAWAMLARREAEIAALDDREPSEATEPAEPLRV